MIDNQNTSRRNFLRIGSAFATVAGFGRFGLMNAFAQGASDYKALVCVFLLGGNDSHNMVVPQTRALTTPTSPSAARWPCRMAMRSCCRFRLVTVLSTLSTMASLPSSRSGRNKSSQPWPMSECWCSLPAGSSTLLVPRPCPPTCSLMPIKSSRCRPRIRMDRAALVGRAVWPTPSNP